MDKELVFFALSLSQEMFFFSIKISLNNIGFSSHRYWPYLDGKIREALILRNIKVRLLISYSKNTDPLTVNFVSSLKAICTEVSGCSLKVVSIPHIISS